MTAPKRKCDEQQWVLPPLELVDDNEWNAIEAAFDAVSKLPRTSSILPITSLSMVSTTTSSPAGPPLCRFSPSSSPSAGVHLTCPTSSISQFSVPRKPLDSRGTALSSPDESASGVFPRINGGALRTGFQSRSLGGSARAQSANQFPEFLSSDSSSKQLPREDVIGTNCDAATPGPLVLPVPKSFASGTEEGKGFRPELQRSVAELEEAQFLEILSGESLSKEVPGENVSATNTASAMPGTRILPSPGNVASGVERESTSATELDGAQRGNLGTSNAQLVRRLPSWMVGCQYNPLSRNLSTELGDLALSVERSMNNPYALVQFEQSFQWGLNPSLLHEIKPKIPAMQFRGQIVYSKTESEVEAATRALCERVRELQETTVGAVPIGLDLEWKTTYERGEAPRKAAVLQLCLDGQRCDVMQIIYSGIPSALQDLLEGSSTVKVGVGVHGDAAKLRHDYKIATRRFLDLRVIANKKMNNSKQWSLSSLARELTGEQVEKTQSVRCGDWEACPLSQPQLQYAATDAFASWHLYQVLASFPNCEIENTENNSGGQ